MNRIDTDHEDINNFRKIFKYYKANNPKPSLEKVLCVDFCNDMVRVIKSPSKITEDHRTTLLGLQPLSNWKLYSFSNHPGLILIRNPFTCIGQRYWIRKCLETYSRKPNKTNIDIEMFLADWWAECFENGLCNEKLQKKLRWTTLGYHHNWDTKVYSDENRTSFPEDLSELSDLVACYLGYNNYKAEAAIVNYYHMGSTLSPHTDHSEFNLSAPLLSFSFGQSAVFLIGGNDKSIEPTPILLTSGDIVIMSEKARLCYHAVPKILSSTSEPWNWNEKPEPNTLNKVIKVKYISNQEKLLNEMNENVNNNTWNVFNAFIRKSRINMNVRQVQ